MVGDCKTTDEAQKLLKDVKRIRLTCLDKFPVLYQNRKGKGLNRAFQTTNPFAPSQMLYPGGPVTAEGLPVTQGQAFDPFVAAAAFEKVNAKKVDPQVVEWNQGPSSIFKNPAKYALQVAEYTGRSGVSITAVSGLGEKLPQDEKFLKTSPLMKAGEESEQLAAALNRCKSMGGMKAYTYHTRYSSFVLIGGFSGPDDPSLKALHGGNQIAEISNELMKRRLAQIPLRPTVEPLLLPKLDK